ncbi:MAG: T9SS type A sorting domain-containing protein [Bacteroidia bacterium]|nr:T9SS type A sorting domain-containing protein [Bacteroidia bacterium]
MKLVKFKTFVILSVSLLAIKLSAQEYASLSFNGQDNYVEIEDSPLNEIGSGDFTFEAWINGEESKQTSHPMIFSNRGPSPSGGGGVLFFFHNKWRDSKTKILSVQIDEVNYKFENNGTLNASLLDGQCHHVAVTRKDSILSFYADGQLFGESRIITSPASVSLERSLLIGKDLPTNNTFNGIISQVRIWNVAKTKDELNNAKDVSLSGNESGLVAYYEMQDFKGQVLTDKTGNHHGRLGDSILEDVTDPAWICSGCVKLNILDEGVDQSKVFNVYPNPSSDFLFINAECSEAFEVRLFDVAGRLVAKHIINSQEDRIDIKDLSEGVYLLDSNIADNKITRRVVKI